jgi:hypothetical protein
MYPKFQSLDLVPPNGTRQDTPSGAIHCWFGVTVPARDQSDCPHDWRSESVRTTPTQARRATRLHRRARFCSVDRPFAIIADGFETAWVDDDFLYPPWIRCLCRRERYWRDGVIRNVSVLVALLLVGEVVLGMKHSPLALVGFVFLSTVFGRNQYGVAQPWAWLVQPATAADLSVALVVLVGAAFIAVVASLIKK